MMNMFADVWDGTNCMAKHLVSIGLLSLMVGCATVPIAAPPQIVTTTHTVYQPIPAAYLQHCLLPIGTPPQNGNLLELEQEAVRYLMDCNKQLDRIKTLAPSATTHP